MNKLKYTLMVALAAGTLLAGAGFALANGHGWGGYSSLTPEQAAIVEKHHAEHYAAVAPLQAKLQQLRADMYAEQVKENPDSKKIMQLAEEEGKVRGQMHVQGIEMQKKLTAAGIPAHMAKGMGHGMKGGMMKQGMGKGMHGGGHGGMGQGMQGGAHGGMGQGMQGGAHGGMGQGMQGNGGCGGCPNMQ